jgi:hypothetical protein
VFRVIWDRQWQGTALVAFRLDPDGKVAGLEIDELELRRKPEGTDSME